MPADVLLNLAANFMMISLLSVGGGAGTLPEMHRNAVDSQGWMSSAQFAELYALAQAGLIPVTVGLMFAAAWLVSSGAVHGWPTLVIAAVSALIMATTRLNPRRIIAAGAVAGLMGWA